MSQGKGNAVKTSFIRCSDDATPDLANDLYNDIKDYFKKRNATEISFECLFNYLKAKKSPGWSQYVRDDRSLFRAFLKVCDPKFHFPDDSLIYLTLRYSGPEKMRHDLVQKSFRVENIEKRHLFRKIFDNYDVIFEYEAISCVASICFQMCEHVGRVRYDFVQSVLNKKFECNDLFADLKQYVGDVKTFTKERTYIFDCHPNSGVRLRPKFYVKVLFELNEFLRDLAEDEKNKNNVDFCDGTKTRDNFGEKSIFWCPLVEMINYYLRTPKISDQTRMDMKLTSRDEFLNFLISHPLVFDLKLEIDFQVTSNLLLPEFNFDDCGVLKICKNFDAMADEYRRSTSETGAKSRTVGPKPPPECNKPLLSIVRNFSPKLDKVKSASNRPTTVRRPETFWTEQIEAELDACHLEDV